MIAVVLLVPGYIAQRRGEHTHNRRTETEGLRWLALTLAYSMVVYAIVALITAPFGVNRDTIQAWIDGSHEPWQYAVAALTVLMLAYIVAEVERLWVTRDASKSWTDLSRWVWKVNERHAIAGAWDWILGQAEPKFVIVTLKGGSEIGGYFGYDSFAAYSTENGADLYIEAVIPLRDGWFEDIDDSQTAGAWIARDEIQSIEFYPAPEPDTATADNEPSDDSEEPTVE